MRHKGRRRTLFSLVGALGLAASVFLYFQLFSVEMIDFHKHESELFMASKENFQLTPKKDYPTERNTNIVHHNLRDSEKWKKHSSDDCDSPDCDDMEQNLKLKNKLFLDKHEKVVNGNINHATGSHSAVLSGKSLRIDAIAGLPQGAKRELATSYKANDQNTFICIHSKVECIQFKKIYIIYY